MGVGKKDIELVVVEKRETCTVVRIVATTMVQTAVQTKGVAKPLLTTTPTTTSTPTRTPGKAEEMVSTAESISMKVCLERMDVQMACLTPLGETMEVMEKAEDVKITALVVGMMG